MCFLVFPGKFHPSSVFYSLSTSTIIYHGLRRIIFNDLRRVLWVGSEHDVRFITLLVNFWYGIAVLKEVPTEGNQKEVSSYPFCVKAKVWHKRTTRTRKYYGIMWYLSEFHNWRIKMERLEQLMSIIRPLFRKEQLRLPLFWYQIASSMEERLVLQLVRKILWIFTNPLIANISTYLNYICNSTIKILSKYLGGTLPKQKIQKYIKKNWNLRIKKDGDFVIFNAIQDTGIAMAQVGMTQMFSCENNIRLYTCRSCHKEKNRTNPWHRRRWSVKILNELHSKHSKTGYATGKHEISTSNCRPIWRPD